MKCFMKEFSKAVLVVFLVVCAFIVVCYEAQIFIALFVADKDFPESAVVMTAITAGFVGLLGNFAKSFLEKNSLNKNGLKITKAGDVKKIDTKQED